MITPKIGLLAMRLIPSESDHLYALSDSSKIIIWFGVLYLYRPIHKALSLSSSVIILKSHLTALLESMKEGRKAVKLSL